MKKRLKEIENEALELIEKAQNMEVIQELKVKFLGKKGELKSILKSMGSLTPEEKKELGQEANRVREKIENLIAESMEKVKKAEQKEKFLKEKVDVTEPGKVRTLGTKHPLTVTIEEISNIFMSMG